jgi:hypothetical protein
MPNTIVGMTAEELSNRFTFYMDPNNLQPLAQQVMGRLNAAGVAMGVTSVVAERSAGLVPGVQFTITAPHALAPADVKAALR